MVWLRVHDLPPEHEAAVTGYTAHWGRGTTQRGNQSGPIGPGNRRHRHPGSAGLLSAAPSVALANRYFVDFDAMQTIQTQGCLTPQAMPEDIRTHINLP